MMKINVLDFAPLFGYRTSPLITRFRTACSSLKTWPYLIVFDYNFTVSGSPGYKGGRCEWDGGEGVILFWVGQLRWTPRPYLEYLLYHELRHAYQSKYNTINDAERERILGELHEKYPEKSRGILETEFHDSLPEECDADGFAIQRAHFRGLDWERDIIRTGHRPETIKVKDYYLWKP